MHFSLFFVVCYLILIYRWEQAIVAGLLLRGHGFVPRLVHVRIMVD